jgi:hypothetical protein
MDYRRTINVSFNVNSLEHSVLQWLSQRQARNESETLRELIRKAGDEAGFFSELAKANVGETVRAEPANVAS